MILDTMPQSPKYKRFYQIMLEQNKEKFVAFKQVHDRYEQNKNETRDEFNLAGKPVLDIIRDWERRLCSGMERGQYAGYSSRLAEKFWIEVKKDFPLIEEVGVTIKKK